MDSGKGKDSSFLERRHRIFHDWIGFPGVLSSGCKWSQLLSLCPRDSKVKQGHHEVTASLEADGITGLFCDVVSVLIVLKNNNNKIKNRHLLRKFCLDPLHG